MPPSPLARLRKICLAFPEAHEVEAWQSPTFRVRNKIFAMYAAPSESHRLPRPSVWIKATSQEQAILIAGDPGRFFSPPYVGKSGWIGVWLDQDPDWPEVKALLGDAWRATAPKTLATPRRAKQGATPRGAKREGRSQGATTRGAKREGRKQGATTRGAKREGRKS